MDQCRHSQLCRPSLQLRFKVKGFGFWPNRSTSVLHARSLCVCVCVCVCVSAHCRNTNSISNYVWVYIHACVHKNHMTPSVCHGLGSGAPRVCTLMVLVLNPYCYCRRGAYNTNLNKRCKYFFYLTPTLLYIQLRPAFIHSCCYSRC